MSKVLTAYEERHLTLMDELGNSSDIRVLAENRGPLVTAYGDAQTVAEKLVQRFGVVLDASLQSHFLRFRNLACQWQTTSADRPLTGEFGLKNLYTSITTGPLEILRDFPSEADRRLASGLRLLDDQPEGGAGSFAALRIQPGRSFPEVWYFTVAHGFQELDIGYADYLDLLLTTKGVYDWQYLFADVSLRETECNHVRNRLTGMLNLFPGIFPECDYSDLRARLRERM
ncbi:hypothetical protein [Streptomyces sp. NBC_01508]|uniref:hypothetical protein n=1 Tax=Streptomyces sp. NBC_01508 TaxID=2903888 RepID=UPI003870B260